MRSSLDQTVAAAVSSERLLGRIQQHGRLVAVRTVAHEPALTTRGCLAGKRAAVVVYSYYSEDPRVRRAAQALRRQGMEVDVVCLRRERGMPLHGEIDGVNVFRVPLMRRREGKWRYVTQYTQFFVAAFGVVSIRHLRRHYDLVHVHNMPDFLVFSALLPRLSGAKILLDLHDPMPELFRGIYSSRNQTLLVRSLEQVEKLSIAFADRVLTPNLAFARLFASRSCAAEKIEIVMNSPEGTIFDSGRSCTAVESTGKKSFDLIYHGLLAERQGVDLAVRAVCELRNRIPNLKLHLYGEPTPYIEHVMQLAKELKVEDRVHYHGLKALDEIPGVISAADLGLVPNRLNPFTALNMPTRIFEYLALNKMAVVPRTKGIVDYFKEDEIIFFEPGNLTDLASKIEWTCFHPAQAQAILERGRKVYQSHRWDLEEERFLELVRALIAPS